jgi:hypothetical protein
VEDRERKRVRIDVNTRRRDINSSILGDLCSGDGAGFGLGVGLIKAVNVFKKNSK